MERPGPRRALLVGIALVLIAAIAAPTASAHAQLLRSDPMTGARLDAMPSQVTVQLSEPVDASASAVHVLDKDGRGVDAGDVLVQPGQNPLMSVRLRSNLPDGAYRIAWTAISGTDGHHTEGTIGFAVGPFTPPATTTQSLNKLDPTSAVARTLSYTGFALVFAAAAFLLLLVPLGYPPTLLRRAMLWGATAHLAGTLLLAAGSNSAGLAWGAFGASDVGRVLLWRLILGAGAWVLAILATVRPTRTAPFAITLLLFGAALGSARLAHGWSDGPATMALDVTHLISASVWVGGLLLLAWFLRQRAATMAPEKVRAIGTRFGTLALACVIVLAFTGSIVALAILGRERILHPGSTLTSAYGLFLAGKILIGLVMVALAALNRYVFLEAPTETGLAGGLQRAARKAKLVPLDLSGPRGLRRAVVVEALLGCVVLVLAGFLTSVSPPTAEATPAMTLAQQGEHYLVHLVVDPAPAAGQYSMLELRIEDAVTGAVLSNNTCGRDSCVTLRVSYAGMNGTEGHIASPGDSWMVHDLIWGRAGVATIHVDIQSADVFHDAVTFELTVA